MKNWKEDFKVLFGEVERSENIRVFIEEIESNSYQQALLDILAHFGGFETPLVMTNEQVQEEIEEFMELSLKD